MLYITRNEKKCEITDVESYFKVIAINNNLFNNVKCIDAMKKIDNADYMGNGIITTPLGTTNIQDLSTGCKTVLLILINYEQKDTSVISMMECGDNAIEYIFDLAINIDIHVFNGRSKMGIYHIQHINEKANRFFTYVITANNHTSYRNLSLRPPIPLPDDIYDMKTYEYIIE